jgi:hypothetical protein
MQSIQRVASLWVGSPLNYSFAVLELSSVWVPTVVVIAEDDPQPTSGADGG